MAKAKARFSAETRAKIAAKATEREAKKRALKAAESLRPAEGSVSLEVRDGTSGKVKGSATLHANGKGSPASVVDVIGKALEQPLDQAIKTMRAHNATLDKAIASVGRATVIPATTFSPQARRSLAKLHAERVAAIESAETAKAEAKAYRETLIAQIDERETILTRCVVSPGVAEFSPGNSAAIVSISKTIEDLRRRIAGLRETYKLNRLRASEALSHIDQIVAGESPEGTIFANEADRKAGGR